MSGSPVPAMGGAMRTVRIVALVVASVAATVLVGQNTEVVEFRLLFWTVQMSRIILLSIALGLGFTAGFVSALLWRSRPFVKHGAGRDHVAD